MSEVTGRTHTTTIGPSSNMWSCQSRTGVPRSPVWVPEPGLGLRGPELLWWVLSVRLWTPDSTSTPYRGMSLVSLLPPYPSTRPCPRPVGKETFDLTLPTLDYRSVPKKWSFRGPNLLDLIELLDPCLPHPVRIV